ncbi:hypothetical protein [Pelomonas sp. Root1217]|uniref:hypothetical protein n=1 Tax=Pelomonas sp. Root1217 TaxID=1736430 RepID=UPI0012F75C1E|nr:hypothetical protein [Pelomonas sp. Root1217]
MSIANPSVYAPVLLGFTLFTPTYGLPLCSGCRHRRSAAEFTMPGMKQSLVHLAG